MIMRELRYTLLSDGSSDRALISLLTWLLQEHLTDCAIQSEWADLGRLRKPPKTLLERIKTSLDLYPCDLLFIHRDAEREPRNRRVDEIHSAIGEVVASVNVPPVVCVVPVRMLEAWLLFDEVAVRRASGNPYGKQPLQLPNISKVEAEPDPKEVLYQILRQASGLSSRRQQKLSVHKLVHRVAELIDDFSPLRCLPAFIAMEAEIQNVIKELV
jgi:Domain of unknown function (DUF4276)